MRALGLFLSITLIAAAEARIGETAIQFVDRYGAPKDDAGSRAMDKHSPLVEGAIHHRYEFQGWKIRAAFLQLDGPAVRMDFSKLPNGQSIQIQDYELQAIASANTPAGMSWKKIMYNNPDLPGNALTKLGQAYFITKTPKKAAQPHLPSARDSCQSEDHIAIVKLSFTPSGLSSKSIA